MDVKYFKLIHFLRTIPKVVRSIDSPSGLRPTETSVESNVLYERNIAYSDNPCLPAGGSVGLGFPGDSSKYSQAILLAGRFA